MAEWIISSSVLILAVAALRFALRGRAGPRFQYALWGLALLRLLVPVSLFQSGLSVMNAVNRLGALSEPAAAVSAPDEGENTPAQTGGAQTAGSEANEVVADNNIMLTKTEPAAGETAASGAPAASGGPVPLSAETVWKLVWIGGACAVALWHLAVNLRFARRLRRTRRPFGIFSADAAEAASDAPVPVYVVRGIKSPCLFGLFRPAVYLTPEVAGDGAALPHVLAHEVTHWRHGDHIWSLLRGLALALHWYNPLAWLAAVLSRRDAELCCDAGAIRRLGESARMDYGRTLIGLVAGKTQPRDLLICATTMTGSERGIKERVKMIAKNPKTAVYTLIAVILMAALAVGCTFTGAASESGADSEASVAESPAIESGDAENTGNEAFSIEYVPVTDEDNPFDGQDTAAVSHQSLRLGDGIGGMESYVELWINGKLYSSGGSYGATGSALDVYAACRFNGEEPNVTGGTWAVKYLVDGTLKGRDEADLHFPAGYTAQGWASAFYGQSGGDESPIEEGKDYILAAYSFGADSSELTGNDCEAMTEDSSRIAEFECIAVLRAVFHETEEGARRALLGLDSASAAATPYECLFYITGQSGDGGLVMESYNIKEDYERYVNSSMTIMVPTGGWVLRLVNSALDLFEVGPWDYGAAVNLSVLVDENADVDQALVDALVEEAEDCGFNVITDPAHPAEYGWSTETTAVSGPYETEDIAAIPVWFFNKIPPFCVHFINSEGSLAAGRGVEVDIDSKNLEAMIPSVQDWTAALDAGSWTLLTDTNVIAGVNTAVDYFWLQNGAGDWLCVFEHGRYVRYTLGGAAAWFTVADPDAVFDALEDLIYNGLPPR